MRKINYNPYDSQNNVVSSLGCMDDNEPHVLVNGWVWNNKYYSTLEDLNKELCQRIHIGKSSAGWRFGLCVYPKEHAKYSSIKYLDKPIESLEDWIELFNNPNNYIEDEYGRIITSERMIDIIAHKHPQDESLDGWLKIGEGTSFESDEKYFFIKGLVAHKPVQKFRSQVEQQWASTYEKYVTIMPRDCTYDLILSGNDSNICEIFS